MCGLFEPVYGEDQAVVLQGLIVRRFMMEVACLIAIQSEIDRSFCRYAVSLVVGEYKVDVQIGS